MKFTPGLFLAVRKEAERRDVPLTVMHTLFQERGGDYNFWPSLEMTCRHGKNKGHDCDHCWREALEDTVARNGPEAVRRIEEYDLVPEPGMFGQPTPLLSVDWLQTVEHDFLQTLHGTRPLFHRFIGWIGRI